MNWKKSLDKYLTSEPGEDGFFDWYDIVLDIYLSNEFYSENEDWLLSSNGQCNKWMNKLFFIKGKSPEEAASIIERTVKIFIK
jgi:hypothetical protein